METDPEPNTPPAAPPSEARTQTRGFLFADLRGYTAFVDRQGDVAAAKLLKRYRAIVRQAVARHEGAEIRTEGDGFYVVFPSASSAVRCALAIIEEAARSQGGAADEAAPPEEPLRVAIGIHAGETADTAEGYVGSAVNTAARICSVAREGEVLVSDTVRSLTRTLLPVSFVSRGAPRLKGLAEPIHLYRVLAAGTAPAAVARPRRWQRPGSAISFVAVAGLVALGLATIAILASLGGTAPGTAPTADPRGSPTAAGNVAVTPATPAAVASVVALTSAERDLLARIPGAIGERCVTQSQRPPGTDARFRCPLPLGAEADTVWYDRYETRALLDVAVADLVRDNLITAGDCASVAQASDTWTTPLGTFSGKRLCYPSEGSSSLAWTYDDDLILATANRGDDDWAALFEWWKGVGPFLRSR